MAAALLSSRVALRPNAICFYSTSKLVSSRAFIRCSASNKDEQPPIENPEVVTPPPVKKPEASFFDLFAFSGPVPETVNGRLAMVGFTAALAVEIASGQGLLGQIDNGGTNYFVGAALLFTLASLIPLSQGVSVDKASGGIGGIFTSRAERWNGRAAMLGLVALALTEFVKGSPLI